MSGRSCFNLIHHHLNYPPYVSVQPAPPISYTQLANNLYFWHHHCGYSMDMIWLIQLLRHPLAPPPAAQPLLANHFYLPHLYGPPPPIYARDPAFKMQYSPTLQSGILSGRSCFNPNYHLRKYLHHVSANPAQTISCTTAHHYDNFMEITWSYQLHWHHHYDNLV